MDINKLNIASIPWGRRGLEEERYHGNQGVGGSNLAYSSSFAIFGL